MSFTDLIPWGRNRALSNNRSSADGDPFFALHREMNRLFDDFNRGFGAFPTARNGSLSPWPNVEITETDNALKVLAELPGFEQKDVDVTLKDGLLTIKGERKSEAGSALYTERWHGQFRRSLELGAEIDPDRVTAAFKDGVLTITLGKRAGAESDVKRIPIGRG